MKLMRISSAILIALFLSGCQTISQYDRGVGLLIGVGSKVRLDLGYDGPVRPMSEVGVLISNGNAYIRKLYDSSGRSIVRRSVNTAGVAGLSGSVYQLHLQPGEYSAEFCFWAHYGTSIAQCTTSITKKFRVEPNKITMFAESVDRGGWELEFRDGEDYRVAVTEHFRQARSLFQ